MNGFGEPNFGCIPLDVVCLGQEGTARFYASGLIAMGNFMADMLRNAFRDSRASDSSWEIADDQFWFWVSVMSGVLVCVALFQLLPAAFLRDGKRIARIAGGLAFSIPASVIAVYLMQQLASFGNQVTDSLTRALQDDGIAGGVLRMFGYQIVNDDISFREQSAILRALSNTVPALAVGQYGITFLIVCLMALASAFLYVAMAIRNFALIVLAATAPIGIMMIGQPKLGVWANRWVNLVVGLILAEPLAAAVLVVAVRLLGLGTDMGPLLVAAGALFAASFAPVWAVKLVSFAGGEMGTSFQNRPSISRGVGKAAAVVRVARFRR